jgi:hypothetical protein
MTKQLVKPPAKKRARVKPEILELPAETSSPDMSISPAVASEVDGLNQRIIDAVNYAKTTGVAQGFIVAVLHGAALRETEMMNRPVPTAQG